MNVASCGLGTNSIAGIIHAVNAGFVFDEILFANTGRGKKFGERTATYEYLKIFNRWLTKHGQKEIKIVYSKNNKGKSISLYEEMYKLGTLPAIVFGFKTCSQRFKAQPQEKHLNHTALAKETWSNGDKVTKWIFYDAGESHRAKDYEDEKYTVRYYLIENDIDRQDCENIITEAGLPLPAKSSCFHCPSMQPWEIIELYLTERVKFYEAVELERNAARSGKMSAIKGLGRDFSWWDLIVAYRYMNWVKRSNNLGITIDKAVAKLMKKITRSEKKRDTPKIKKVLPTESPKEIACSLFVVHEAIPCGCYD